MNVDLSVVQGLSAWREILEQEYYRIEENQRKVLKPIEYPYKQNSRILVEEDTDRHRVSRQEVAHYVKRVLRDYAMAHAGQSIQAQKDLLLKLFATKDSRKKGTIHWEDFMHVVNFQMGIIFSLSEITLLKKHLKLREHDKISYVKFINALYAVKAIPAVQKRAVLLAPAAPKDKFQQARARRYEQVTVLERAQDERVKRFLTWIMQRAVVYGLQKRIGPVEAIERVFHSVCGQTVDEKEQRLTCAELFMSYEACLDVRIAQMEQPVIFKRLVLHSVAVDSISFAELLQCFYCFEVLKEEMPIGSSGSTFDLLQNSRKFQ